MKATLGNGIVVDGLACTPTIPASMSVRVLPGSLVQTSVVDATYPSGGDRLAASSPSP
jgi:hypothetical protein